MNALQEIVGGVFLVQGELKRDQDFLNCLAAAGVDNWEGYEYAQELMDDDDEDEEDV